MTSDEIRKALRKGYRQEDNLRRAPFVVAGVLLILLATALFGVFV
jgi:hypothetical protein